MILVLFGLDKSFTKASDPLTWILPESHCDGASLDLGCSCFLPRSVTASLAVPGTKVEESGRGAAGVTTDARPPPLTFGQKKSLLLDQFWHFLVSSSNLGNV